MSLNVLRRKSSPCLRISWCQMPQRLKPRSFSSKTGQTHVKHFSEVKCAFFVGMKCNGPPQDTRNEDYLKLFALLLEAQGQELAQISRVTTDYLLSSRILETLRESVRSPFLYFSRVCFLWFCSSFLLELGSHRCLMILCASSPESLDAISITRIKDQSFWTLDLFGSV